MAKIIIKICSANPEAEVEKSQRNERLVMTGRYREWKFKRALKLHFWLILQNLFCRFLTEYLSTDSDMIYPVNRKLSIATRKQFSVDFLKITWETEKENFTTSNFMRVYKYFEFQNVKFPLSVSHIIFKK